MSSEKLTPMMQQYFEVKQKICSPVFSGLFAGVQSEGKLDFRVRRRLTRNAEFCPGGYKKTGIKSSDIPAAICLERQETPAEVSPHSLGSRIPTSVVVGHLVDEKGNGCSSG